MMQDKQVFEYAVIRYVPRVEREEFLNVGVMLFCKRKKYLQMKFHLNKARLAAFAADVDIEELTQYLEGWDLVCQGGSAGGPIGLLEPAYRFRWLSAAKSTILQCSKVHPGRCVDPAAVLEDLFRKYVS